MSKYQKVKSIFRKFRALILIIKEFKNWHEIILARYGFLGNGFAIAKLRNGIKIKFRKNSQDVAIMNEIFAIKAYNRFHSINKNDMVIDIGAHIGVFTLYAASKGARVFSYEPERNNFSLLKENILLNSFEKQTKIFNFAVGGDREIANIFI